MTYSASVHVLLLSPFLLSLFIMWYINLSELLLVVCDATGHERSAQQTVRVAPRYCGCCYAVVDYNAWGTEAACLFQIGFTLRFAPERIRLKRFQTQFSPMGTHSFNVICKLHYFPIYSCSRWSSCVMNLFLFTCTQLFSHPMSFLPSAATTVTLSFGVCRSFLKRHRFFPS